MNPKNFLAGLFALVTSATAHAEDWPTYRHDSGRSGVVNEEIPLPLKASWSRLSPTPPKTAWARPAKWDAYSGIDGLQAMRNFDGAFYVTVSGDSVYFGSSLDDAVHCLDAKTGNERWVAFAGAPVRLPPTISDGLAYFGADDGFAYCVDARTGDERWKVRAAPSERLIPSDGRMISPWPVRTGVLVKDGTAFFGASLLPWKNSVLWGVDAASGKVEGEGRFRSEVNDVTMQGMMLAGGNQLLVPQGRAQVLRFDAEGKAVGQFANAGGVHCAVVDAGGEAFLISGPTNQKAQDNVVVASGFDGESSACSISNTLIAVSADGVLFTNNGDKLAAIDVKARADLQRRANQLKRKAAKGITPEEKEEFHAIPEKIAKTVQWTIHSAPAFDMIIVGDHILLGCANRVKVHRRDNGELIWEAGVDGLALGLAYAGNRLYVSTDLGHIFTFSSE